MRKPTKTPKYVSPEKRARRGIANEYRFSGNKMRDEGEGDTIVGKDMLPEETAEPDRTKKPFNTQTLAKGGKVVKPRKK